MYVHVCVFDMCMNQCASVCVCVCVSVYVYGYVYLYVYLCFICVCMHVCTFASLHVRIVCSMYVCVCMYVCSHARCRPHAWRMCIQMCLCVCVLMYKMRESVY